MATFKQIIDKVPARLNIGLMIFFSIFFLYLVRAHFSINLLAMVEPTLTDANGTIIQLPDYGPRYSWNSYDQSLLLGAYFWGYTITSIPSGVLIDKFGYAKANIGFVFALCTVLVALSPVLAVSFAATLVQRFAIGFISGGLVPAVNKIISKWSPPDEKGKFMSTLFGTDIGTVVAWSLCGVLIESFGWEIAFYVPAVLTGLFTVLWYFVVYDTPAEHPRILPTEKVYIENSLIGINEGLKSWPPMWSIVKSIPYWALLLLHYGHIWGMYFLLTAAPKFMNEVLHYDLTAAGFLASVPYLVRLFTGIMFGAIGDYLKTKHWISQNFIRKGFCLLSHVLPGLFLAAIPYVSSEPLICVAFMTLSYGFNGAVTMTGYQNVHDLAPNYATTLYSIMNGVASTAGFISPIVVGYFTRDSNTIDEWTIIFIIGAVVYIVPAGLFVIFGSVKIQSWNEPPAKLSKSVEATEKHEATTTN